jgi:hypothetical protein
MKNPNPWYNKTILVVLSLIFFFPVGLYALWKNEKAPKPLKIIVSVFFAIALILSMNAEPIPEKFDLQKEKEDELRSIAFYAEQNIIDNLKDPDSYEVIFKDYVFMNDSIYKVTIRYSGTNSFNARIQNQYIRTGVLKFNPADTSFTDIVKFEK